MNKNDYFIAGPGKETDEAARAKVTKEMPTYYNDVLGIGCFKGTFSLQINEGANHIRPHPDAWHMKNHSEEFE